MQLPELNNLDKANPNRPLNRLNADSGISFMLRRYGMNDIAAAGGQEVGVPRFSPTVGTKTLSSSRRTPVWQLDPGDLA